MHNCRHTSEIFGHHCNTQCTNRGGPAKLNLREDLPGEHLQFAPALSLTSTCTLFRFDAIGGKLDVMRATLRPIATSPMASDQSPSTTLARNKNGKSLESIAQVRVAQPSHAAIYRLGRPGWPRETLSVTFIQGAFLSHGDFC